MELYYIIIYQSMLFSIVINQGDALAVPPTASLVVLSDWQGMVAAAGSEQNLLSNLGIIADYRTPYNPQ
jgi:hypothetical protein